MSVGTVNMIQNFLVGRDDISPTYVKLDAVQKELMATVTSSNASMAQLSSAMKAVGGSATLTGVEIQKVAFALAAQGKEMLAGAAAAETMSSVQMQLQVQTQSSVVAMARGNVQYRESILLSDQLNAVKISEKTITASFTAAQQKSLVKAHETLAMQEQENVGRLITIAHLEQEKLERLQLSQGVAMNTASLRANQIVMEMGQKLHFEGSAFITGYVAEMGKLTAVQLQSVIATEQETIAKAALIIKDQELQATVGRGAIIKQEEVMAQQRLIIQTAQLNVARAQSVLVGIQVAEADVAAAAAATLNAEAVAAQGAVIALKTATAEAAGIAAVAAAHAEGVAVKAAAVVQVESVGKSGAALAMKAFATIVDSEATQTAAAQEIWAAKVKDKNTVSTRKATVAVVAHTAAQEGLSMAFIRNQWLGVSAGGVIEKVGSGARLSGFDVGFMAFHLGMVGIAAAVATAALNVLGDEMTSIEQLRFAVENLGLTWDQAGFEEKVITLRDATGNTAREIREVMATLGAVTGGLIHSQQELVNSAELVLDLMLRTGASAQLASRIVARTMAGNLESLRKRFPGFTQEVDNLRAVGASLQERGDWGMSKLREQVSGAASEISKADRISASLRNSLIELAIGAGRVAAPALLALAGVLRVLGEGITIIGPALPYIAGGMLFLKVAVTAVSAAIAAQVVGLGVWSTAFSVLQSKFVLWTVAVTAAALMIKGLKAAWDALKIESAENQVERLKNEFHGLGRRIVGSNAIMSEFGAALANDRVTLEEYADTLLNAQHGFDDMTESLSAQLRNRLITTQQYRTLMGAVERATRRASNELADFGDIVESIRDSQQAGISEFLNYANVIQELGVHVSDLADNGERMYSVFLRYTDLLSANEDLFYNLSNTPLDLPDFGSLDELEAFVDAESLSNDLRGIRDSIREIEQEALDLYSTMGGLDPEETRETRDKLDELEQDRLDLIGDYRLRERAERLAAQRQDLTDAERLAEALRRLREREERERRRLFETMVIAAQSEVGEATERARQLNENLREHYKVQRQMHQEMLDRKREATEEYHKNQAIAAREFARFQEDMLVQSLSGAGTTFAERMDQVSAGLVESPSFTELWNAPKRVQEAWSASHDAMISGVMGIGRSLSVMMGDSVAAKTVIWLAEAAGQFAYAAAHFMEPMIAAGHVAAGTAFLYAASQAGKVKGKTGGGGGAAKKPPLTRRRQTLEESPDMSLRSPSGMTFYNIIDLRGSVGMDGERIGNELVGLINRGSRFRDGNQLSGNMIGGRWRN